MSLKKTLKAIVKSEGFQKYLCWLGAQYIRLVHATTRWTLVNADIPQKLWQEEKPFILAFWHGRILLMPYSWDPQKKVHMLISQHRDGQLIAQTISHLGINTIAGSTNSGGAAALRSMLRALKKGESIGITPDGPRGPHMRASAGIINLARLSGVPIIPCAYGASFRKHLRSWDKFCVAFPFSKGIFVWGDPIEVPRSTKKEDLANLQTDLEKAITHVTGEADYLSGHPCLEPDEGAKEVA